MDFEEFESKVSKIPGMHEHYIVNGDVRIIGRRNLEKFFHDVRNEASGVAGGKLLVNRVGDLSEGWFAGRPDIWDPEMRKRLTYCVSSELGDMHAAVVQAMDAAANDWERSADVDFKYIRERDPDCSPKHEDVIFSVVKGLLPSGVLAQAPFPEDQRIHRILTIAENYLSGEVGSSDPLDGVLRHELGHVLGFDHEFNRPEAGKCYIQDSNFALTPFDPESIMMYPWCEKDGERRGFNHQLSEWDRRGAACLYGPGIDPSRSNPGCNFIAATSNATGRQVAAKWADEEILGGNWKYYEPIKVMPASIVTITLRRATRSPGDPDLYVRYLDRPSFRESECSPRLDIEEEVCRLRVPERTDGRIFSNIYIGVHGVTDSKYELEVVYVAAQAHSDG